MNVYDFDHTIYRGDCTLNFWLHCIRKCPSVLWALPQTLITAVRFRLGRCSRETFKESFYRFLQYIPDVKQEIQDFWNGHLQKIQSWYLEQKQRDDVIISASPEFLISEVCTRLEVRWIASPVDCKSGRLLAPNCRGAEKVRRFFQEYPQATMDNFYSDSISDAPLAAFAKHAYQIKRGKIVKWGK